MRSGCTGLAMLAMLAAACGGTPGPELLSATPAAGAAGQSIVVAGARLCGGGACAAAGGDLVLELAQPEQAPLAMYSDTALTFTVPAGASGATTLVLTVDDTSSNALAFTVLDEPPGGGAR